MPTYRIGNTATITTTLRNTAGAAVTGAVVVCSVFEEAALVAILGYSNVSMSEQGGGAYQWTVTPAGPFLVSGRSYRVEVTATKAGETATSQFTIKAVMAW